MTFLNEHVTVDVAHNKLMEEYITRLVRTEADLAAVSYALRVTAELYGAMLSRAMDSANALPATDVRHEEALRVGALRDNRSAYCRSPAALLPCKSSK
jgi:pyrroloquinoline quinone (PQQ) biosynthesis protein C